MFDSYNDRKEFFNKNQISFGRYYCVYEVPCIEIIVPRDRHNESGVEEESKKVYLSAFRKYAFQISGTFDGQISCASTPVFGLESIVTAKQVGPSNVSKEYMQKYFIHALAMDAVRYYCAQYKVGVPDTMLNEFINVNKEWNKFVENTYKFCKGEEVDIVTYDDILRRDDYEKIQRD